MNTKKIAQKYFWDIDSGDLDSKKCSFFVIERILENGDEEAIKWLKTKCGKEDLVNVLDRSRRLSPKSKSYWNLILKSWKKRSAPKSSGKRQAIAWKY